MASRLGVPQVIIILIRAPIRGIVAAAEVGTDKGDGT